MPALYSYICVIKPAKVGKKLLFPVQRVAVIVASWAEAPKKINLFLGARKISSIFFRFIFLFFAKLKKKVPSRPFLVTRPLHLKQSLVLVWPKMVVMVRGGAVYSRFMWGQGWTRPDANRNLDNKIIFIYIKIET